MLLIGLPMLDFAGVSLADKQTALNHPTQTRRKKKAVLTPHNWTPPLLSVFVVFRYLEERCVWLQKPYERSLPFLHCVLCVSVARSSLTAIVYGVYLQVWRSVDDVCERQGQ